MKLTTCIIFTALLVAVMAQDQPAKAEIAVQDAAIVHPGNNRDHKHGWGNLPRGRIHREYLKNCGKARGRQAHGRLNRHLGHGRKPCVVLPNCRKPFPHVPSKNAVPAIPEVKPVVPVNPAMPGAVPTKPVVPAVKPVVDVPGVPAVPANPAVPAVKPVVDVPAVPAVPANPAVIPPVQQGQPSAPVVIPPVQPVQLPAQAAVPV